MRVAVVHHTLSSLGGGEKVFTYLVAALNSADIVPDVYALNPVEPGVLERHYGVRVEYRLRRCMRLPRLPAFGIYQRVLAAYASAGLSGYDVVWNTTGVYTPVRRHRVKKYILYVYNPLVTFFGGVVESGALEKYRRGFWRLYFKPYSWLVRRSISGLRRGATVLCVSEFTRERVERFWGVRGYTLYPPVDVERFSEALDGPHRPGVVMVARFTPEKRHLDALRVARMLPDIPFYFVGAANTPYYRRWYERVVAEAESMGLGNVEFYPNAPFWRLVELLGECRVLLHPMRDEDFGLATAEAVCSGAVPVVHDSGGSREIVPIRLLRFNTAEEAARIVSWLCSLPGEVVRSLVEKLMEHVKSRFSAEKFTRGALEWTLGRG